MTLPTSVVVGDPLHPDHHNLLHALYNTLTTAGYVVTVNGASGAVTVTAAGIGAEATGVAAGLVTTEASTRASADTTLQTNITAEATARAAADTAHEADTTNIHGIADTSVLSTTTTTAAAIAAHVAAADPHGDRAYSIQRANHTGTQSADTLTDGTTNKAFLATERTKLAGIETGATANSSDAVLLARANHTGTQLAATISDFNTAVASTAALTAGHTAKSVPVSDTGTLADLVFGASTMFARLASGGIVAATPTQVKTLLAIANTDISGLGTLATVSNLTGPVTSVGAATTIAADAVDNTQLANMGQATFKMRAAGAGTGDPIDGTAAQAKTALAIANTDVSGLGTLSTQSGTFSGASSGTNTGDQTITLTGDVTGSGTGSFAATLASTITAAGPTGSASVVPVITYDAKGRLTTVTTATITPTSIGAATGSGTVGTAGYKNVGNTILDPGTGKLEFAWPVAALVTGTNKTYVSTDRGYIYLRSNSGAAMSDTLPALTNTAADIGYTITIHNEETAVAGLLTMNASGGALFRSSTGTTAATSPINYGSRQMFVWNGTQWNLETGNANLLRRSGTIVAGEFPTFSDTAGNVVTSSGIAVSALAPKASPALTGTPTSTTAAAANNSTQIATTAYADALVSDTAYNAGTWDAVTGIAPSKNAVRDQIVLLATLASPALTGTPLSTTAAQGTNTTQIATTAMVQSEVTLLAPKASPTFTGTVTTPAEVIVTAATLAANAGAILNLGNAATVTYNNSGGIWRGIRADPTIVFAGGAGGATAYAPFTSAATLQNSGANNLTTVISGSIFSDQTTYRADTNTGISFGTAYSLRSAPTFSVLSTGTITAGDFVAVDAIGTVNTGVTMTSATGLLIEDWAGSGTITTQVGIDIAAIAKGATTIGFRNASTMRQVGRAVFGADSTGTWAIHMRKGNSADAAIGMDVSTTGPTVPGSNGAGVVSIFKGTTNYHFLITFNDAGTTRYKSLQLNSTGVTWVNGTAVPA